MLMPKSGCVRDVPHCPEFVQQGYGPVALGEGIGHVVPPHTTAQYGRWYGWLGSAHPFTHSALRLSGPPQGGEEDSASMS